MSAGFRAGQANDGYLQINGTDILSVSSGVLGVKNTGAQSEVRLYCESNNAHYASLKSPPHSDFIGNVTFTLPGTSGSSGQVLQTDGSGNLSWVNQSGGGGGGGVSDKMSEGNTEAEVVDTGSDGHFKVTTEGDERLRIDSDGRLLLGTTSLISSSVASNLQVASDFGPRFNIARSDTTTVAGNLIGAFDFYGNDSNGTYQNCARILAEADLDHGTDDKPTRLTFYTTPDGSATPTEKLRITSGGDIGIGIDPSFPIYTGTNDRNLILGTGSEDSAIQIHSGTSNYGGLYFGDATSGSNRYRGYIEFKHGTNDDFLRFGTASNERLRVGPSGQIGLGGANYGTAGQVLTSGGASGAVSWTTISGGGGSYGNSDVDNHLNSGGASSGQILSWNGSDYAWVADQGGSGGGGISDVVDDTTPQLGGNLDLNSKDITGTGDIDITGEIKNDTFSIVSSSNNTTVSHLGTGSFTIKTPNNNSNDILVWADGNAGIILRTGTGVGVVNTLYATTTGVTVTGTLTATTFSGSGASLTSLPSAQLTGALPAISGANLTNLPGLSNVVEDTTPQLGGNLDVQAREINTSTSNGNIKLAPNGTGVVEIRGAGGGDGTLQLNCSAQSHGIKLKSPPHSAAASYTLTFPNSIVAGKFLTSDSSGNLSFSTKIGSNTLVTPDANADNLVIDTGDVDSGISILSATTGRIYFGDAADDESGSIRYVHTDNSMRFETNSEEKVRITSGMGGNLLVGMDTAYNPNVTAQIRNGINIVAEDENGDVTQVNNAGEAVGRILFGDTRPGTYGEINCIADGAPGTNDHPGRLVFRTTADGSGSTAERMRISSNGHIRAYGDSGTSNITDAQAEFATLNVVVPSAGGTSALNVLARGSGTQENIVLRSLSNDGWAGAQFRAENYNFTIRTTNVLTVDFNGSAQFKGKSRPSGLDTRISQYGSFLVGTSGELISNARCSIDSGNGDIKTIGNGEFSINTSTYQTGINLNTSSNLSTLTVYSDASSSTHRSFVVYDNAQSGANKYRAAIYANGNILTRRLFLGGSTNGGFDYNPIADTLEFLTTNGGTHSELTSNAYVPSTNAGKSLGYHNKRWSTLYVDKVAFGGSTNTDQHSLDDYEEGTWTPTVAGGTGSVARAYYIKVGRKVTIFLNVQLSSPSTAGFTVTLPFTGVTSGYTGTSQGVEAHGSCMLYNASMVSSTYNVNVYCWGTTASLYASRTGMAWRHLQGNEVGSSIQLTAHYVSVS